MKKEKEDHLERRHTRVLEYCEILGIFRFLREKLNKKSMKKVFFLAITVFFLDLTIPLVEWDQLWTVVWAANSEVRDRRDQPKSYPGPPLGDEYGAPFSTRNRCPSLWLFSISSTVNRWSSSPRLVIRRAATKMSTRQLTL